MVYRIEPYASHLNNEIDLEFQRSPSAQRGWIDYVLNQELVPAASAPTLILSNKSTPLPSAFDIGSDFWCVSADVRAVMQDLFGSQIAFYEVPVIIKNSGTPLPPTYFVSFSQFRSSIDWSRSKTRQGMRSPVAPEVEVISLADAPGAAIFEPMPSGENRIWIERAQRVGNRFYSPGVHVYATNAAARVIGQSFPDSFVLVELEEGPAPNPN